MKKCKRFNKAIFFPCAVIAAGSVSICATITTTILAERNESDNPIPRKYLLLSDDETILYGFTNKVRQSDIYDYNTLVIPETVTTIAPFAFPYVFDGISTHVKKIVFNEALTTIGNGAFAFCHGLTDTNLYELEQSEKINIANIGDSAFVGSGLTGPLLLPRSIRHIGKRAFAECEFITEVFFPKELESVDEYAFEESGNISKLDFTDLTTIPS
ncbi:MAG: leucine-rich repeat domain-containing protein [Mycoplasmoidaceae bacterium]|nr:leucine-rich repeat domain-containing protein [Mycoplasmoidaceae bacterium]